MMRVALDTGGKLRWVSVRAKETEMTTSKVYANGVYSGDWEADTPEEAIQAAADEVGSVDVGEERANTDGMTAEEMTVDGEEEAAQ